MSPPTLWTSKLLRRVLRIVDKNIRARRQILTMDLCDYFGLSQIENIIIVLQASRMISKAVAAIVLILKESKVKPLESFSSSSVR